MLARKADFNRSDSSACSLAFNNSIPVSLMMFYIGTCSKPFDISFLSKSTARTNHQK
jgi:hypothetical protein